MNVSVIGIVGIPACYGGFESLVENLTSNVSSDINYEVFCSAPFYEDKIDIHNGARLTYIPLQANGAVSVLYDIISMFKCLASKPDVVLILGVSGCVFLPIFRLFSRSKIVTNIDGLEWKRQKWGKFTRAFLKFSEYMAVRFSHHVIADNKAITDYVSNEYDIRAETIAYGGDHSIVSDLKVISDERDFSLALCRIEPENNVEMILRSFSSTDKKIKFVGNWNNSEYGRRLKSKYSMFDNIEICDPIYDVEELYRIRSSCINYIHGHSAGGTNPSLVEMMHFGKPIYAFDCSFNRFTTDNKAAYFANEEDLTKFITSISEVNSQDMLEIAKDRYTWKVISENYELIYRS